MEFLKSAVASAISKGPPFPYSFGDRIDIDHSIWALYNGTRRVCQDTPVPDLSAQADAECGAGRWLSLQYLFL